ncbi:AraC family transcriptional regulator [Alteromonas mediterranea]|uniref:AraC family transcriptional regulator n=1 Tax=Alteromonas mediterranea TaxID=314275 RepID=UPI000903FA44|nr:AraC family transcriptional regulator [Alteromonas mediterranea]APD93589.1 AraC family transcriptional regulator [Alteromonas mediterranea]APD97215.1 AraC family transcriptional regulator [Alteromonas mediterranea]QDG34330.1 AraC family transcriptional regulator [Alteromonas mediterranea]
MSKALIKQLIEEKVESSGLYATGIDGVQLFKITQPIECAPVVYEPSLTAIICGGKEAILNGEKYTFNTSKYTCCTMSMPVEAGIPDASKDSPLLGVYISLNSRMMTDLAIEFESVGGNFSQSSASSAPSGIASAHWDADFTEALYRLLLLTDNAIDIAMLSSARLRELYYSVLKGEAGNTVRGSFGLGNAIGRAIEYLASHVAENVTIDDMASKVGMSKAVFHRKFKQATNMSPIQFVKSMRLNNAAKRIADGTNVSVAAMDVGYVSSSQFSRDFKRMYGLSPKQWEKENKARAATMMQ